jgi:hypothetical protein
MEFFSDKELAMQIGHPRERWPIALLKEMIDNGLDACEKAGVHPLVRVTIDPDALSVADNGPGLPVQVLERSLDFTLRVSDNAYYVSPTRGQLGNALKCIWAAPFVASGTRGRVEVATGGVRHIIDVSLDRIRQQPRIDRDVIKDRAVKTGTVFKMHWPGIASYLTDPLMRDSYRADALVAAYAGFNPHARFELLADRRTVFEPAIQAWKKWLPSMKTSPHWYTPEQLRGLIAAYIANERARSVRDFVAEFHGLQGTLARKAILEKAGLTGASVRDLVTGDDVDPEAVQRLLLAMQAGARPVKPKVLGVVGQHVEASLARAGIEPESIRRPRCVAGVADGLPFVLEVAFGIHDSEHQRRREVIAGVNWSPVLESPFPQLPALLGEARVDANDPVTFVVHLACARPGFTDRGKGRLPLPPAIADALEKLVRLATRGWHESKRQADREDRLSEQQLERLRKARRKDTYSLKAAAYEVMEEAYLQASGDNTYPANARQVMYAARPGVLKLTGGECWSNSSYFTQTLLPNFVDAHPAVVAGWDVVYDARGHLAEPHTGTSFGLGTLEVRNYIGDWTDDCPEELDELKLPHSYPTSGPANRYQFALFVEKEGFGPLLERARIQERFDIAIMSTKGMSVTAARRLIDDLSQRGVTILVLRDFDRSGFSIVHTMHTDSRRYKYRSRPKIIDLGLRLQDVRALRLPSEPVEYRNAKKDPRIRLRECGATPAECKFLVDDRGTGAWQGRRVELNALTSPRWVAFVERKLVRAGVRKLVPSDEVLASAYARAYRIARVQAALDEAVAEQSDAEVPDVPPDLSERVRIAIEKTPEPWDEALWQIVREAHATETGAETE